MCGMDEFSVAVSALQKDSKGKEVLETLDQLQVTVEDHQVCKYCTVCTAPCPMLSCPILLCLT